jgi:hypothetical protein
VAGLAAADAPRLVDRLARRGEDPARPLEERGAGREVRFSSGVPSSASSRRICCDSGGCAMCSRAAARPKCSSSATATK